MTDVDTRGPHTDDEGDEPRSRRQLLRLAGATVAGGAVMAIAGADPAGAADGDPVEIGAANTGSGITSLDSSGGTTALPTLSLTNSGSSGNALYVAGSAGGSGRDIKLSGTGRLAQVGALTGLAAPTFDIVDTNITETVDPAHEIVRSNAGLIWASTGLLAGSNTAWKRMNTVRVDSAAGSGAAFAPFRFIDTRVGTGGVSGKRTVGSATTWNVRNHANIPDDAIAIFGNLTVTDPNFSGWLNIYPSNVSEPLVSAINFASGQTLANFFCVGLSTSGPAGRITIIPRRSAGSGTVHVILDITAYVQ